MAYNTTSFMDKLATTVYMDFGKCHDIIGIFLRSKNDSNYLHVKVKVIMRDDNRDFYLVQIFTMGKEDFNQLTHLRNEFVIAAKNSG